MRVKYNFKWGIICWHRWAHQILYLLCACVDSQLDSNNWMLSLMKISTENWPMLGENKRPKNSEVIWRRELKDPSSCYLPWQGPKDPSISLPWGQDGKRNARIFFKCSTDSLLSAKNGLLVALGIEESESDMAQGTARSSAGLVLLIIGSF